MTITRDLRNPRLWQGLATYGFAAIGVLSACLGLFDLFFPDTFGKVPHPWALAVVGIALMYAVWKSWPYPVQLHYSSPDTRIRLVTGDLFEQQISLAIGVSDCFDVETPHIIATNSVQGQFLSRVYQQDVAALKADLAAALASKVPEETGVAKLGNTVRYPLGTVATIRHQRTHYFCVAYTRMDVNNNVSSSTGILWHALEQLWDEVRARSNGEPVAVPIFGLGQSRMSTVVPIQDAIRFLILSFMFASRRQRVCGELIIVVRPEDEKRVDMLEAHEFLRSLRRYS